MDAQSDIFNISFEFLEGELLLRFSRQIITFDQSEQDVSLDVPRYWIYAIGPYVDGAFTQHDTRGVSNGAITLPSAIECPGNDMNEVHVAIM